MVNLLKLVMGDCCVVALWPRKMHVTVRLEAEQRDPVVNMDDPVHHAMRGVHVAHYCTTPNTPGDPNRFGSWRSSSHGETHPW